MTSAFLSLKPVAEPADFIGREREVRWLCRNIGSDQPECCSIAGLSKTGKTSLLRFLEHPEGARSAIEPLASRNQWARIFVERTRLVVVPMQSIAEWTEKEMHVAIARALYSLSQPGAHGAMPPDSEMRRWRGMRPSELGDEWKRMLDDLVRRAPDPDVRVVIGFDDAEILLESPAATLRANLRHLATDRYQEHLSFVMTTSVPLELLPRHDSVSPLVNIFQEEYLGLLTKDDARELIDRAPEERPSDWAGDNVDQSQVRESEARHDLRLAGRGEAEAGGDVEQPADAEAVAGEALDDVDAEFLLAHAGRHPDILKVGCRYLLEAKRRGPDQGVVHGEAGSPGRAPRMVGAGGRTADAGYGWPSREHLHGAVARMIRSDGHVRGVYDAIVERLRMQPELYETAVAIARTSHGQQSETDYSILAAVSWRTKDRLIRSGVVDDTKAEYGAAAEWQLFASSFRDHLLRQAAALDEGAARERAVRELRYVPGRKEVALGDRRLKLTAIESRLMDRLWANPDEVCGKGELLRDIWGPGSSEAVLEKAVNRLRTKIGRASDGVDYIMTVRGVGYMLQPRP